MTVISSKLIIIHFLIFLIVGYKCYSQIKTDSLGIDTANFAQSTHYTMGKILITGNDVTKDEVILREMYIKENMSFELDDLQDDMTRIYNLGLFSKVNFFPVPSGENIMNLLIEVEELYYILPIPVGGFYGGDVKKFWGGINFRYNNFRGMNESIGAGFTIGYSPSVFLSYFNPWVGKNSHLFFSGNLSYSVSKNNSILDTSNGTTIYEDSKVNDFDIENISASFTIGKYFTKKLSSSIIFGYNYIKPSQNKPKMTLNDEGIDRFVSFIFDINYDNRNLYEYTTYGTYLKVNYSRFGIFSNYFNVNKLQMDFRKYILLNPFKKFEFTYAFRVLSALTFGGNIPSYQKETIGSYDYLRGWKNFIMQGDNKIYIVNELRIPIIKPDYLSGKSIPIIKGISLLNRFSYKYGLYLTFFSDMGSVWNKNDDFYKINFLNSIGSGINLILPFSFVSRFELAYRIVESKLIPQFNLNLYSSF